MVYKFKSNFESFEKAKLILDLIIVCVYWDKYIQKYKIGSEQTNSIGLLLGIFVKNNNPGSGRNIDYLLINNI